MTERPSEPPRTSPRLRTNRPGEGRQRADLLSYPDIAADIGLEQDRESPPSTPRWVKAIGIIGIVLVLVFVGLHITGNAPMHTPSSSGAEHGLRQAP